MRAVFQKILDENAQRYALHASAFAVRRAARGGATPSLGASHFAAPYRTTFQFFGWDSAPCTGQTWKISRTLTKVTKRQVKIVSNRNFL
jgi:hypothetical protein